jgi:hypothetical protein
MGLDEFRVFTPQGCCFNCLYYFVYNADPAGVGTLTTTIDHETTSSSSEPGTTPTHGSSTTHTTTALDVSFAYSDQGVACYDKTQTSDPDSLLGVLTMAATGVPAEGAGGFAYGGAVATLATASFPVDCCDIEGSWEIHGTVRPNTSTTTTSGVTTTTTVTNTCMDKMTLAISKA